MTTRESLHELVDRLTEREAEDLWRKLRRETPEKLKTHQSVLDMRAYPALEEVWNNDDDAVFDTM